MMWGKTLEKPLRLLWTCYQSLCGRHRAAHHAARPMDWWCDQHSWKRISMVLGRSWTLQEAVVHKGSLGGKNHFTVCKDAANRKNTVVVDDSWCSSFPWMVQAAVQCIRIPTTCTQTILSQHFWIQRKIVACGNSLKAWKIAWFQPFFRIFSEMTTSSSIYCEN